MINILFLINTNFFLNLGTGQHAKAFASHFSSASWEPTEFDGSLLNDIKIHCKSMKNVKTPQVRSID